MEMEFVLDVYVVSCTSAAITVGVGSGAFVGSGVGVLSTTTCSSGSSPPKKLHADIVLEKVKAIARIAKIFLFFIVSSFKNPRKLIHILRFYYNFVNKFQFFVCEWFVNSYT